jgi:hypothetical protein
MYDFMYCRFVWRISCKPQAGCHALFVGLLVVQVYSPPKDSTGGTAGAHLHTSTRCVLCVPGCWAVASVSHLPYLLQSVLAGVQAEDRGMGCSLLGPA